MQTFIVKVSAQINYWWDTEYIIKAASVGTAASRALKKIKKEERLKYKRVRNYKLDIKQIS